MVEFPSPDQPLAVRAINGSGRWLRRVGLGAQPLNVERLLIDAQKETKLTDFGDSSCEAGFSVLVDAINNEAELSTIGRIGAKKTITTELAKRLMLIEHRKVHPEVSKRSIERPLFVLGLPRTGSTILFELLARDPNVQAPLSWQVARPFPAETDEESKARRIAEFNKELRNFENLAPSFQAIHEVGAELPQECIAMLQSCFLSEQWGVLYSIPSYRAWLSEQDMAPAYRWHRHFLQHLQQDGDDRRWVLKTPVHLSYIEAVIAEYPDAVIAQTHRDPMRVIASVSSLSATLHSAFSDDVDPIEVGKAECGHYARMLERGTRQREQIEAREGKGRFFDFQFEDILKRPFDAIREMYGHFGFEWTDDTRARMQRYLDNRPRDKRGTHRYTAEDFGLSEAKHGTLFDDYRHKFLAGG